MPNENNPFWRGVLDWMKSEEAKNLADPNSPTNLLSGKTSPGDFIKGNVNQVVENALAPIAKAAQGYGEIGSLVPPLAGTPEKGYSGTMAEQHAKLEKAAPGKTFSNLVGSVIGADPDNPTLQGMQKVEALDNTLPDWVAKKTGIPILGEAARLTNYTSLGTKAMSSLSLLEGLRGATKTAEEAAVISKLTQEARAASVVGDAERLASIGEQAKQLMPEQAAKMAEDASARPKALEAARAAPDDAALALEKKIKSQAERDIAANNARFDAAEKRLNPPPDDDILSKRVQEYQAKNPNPEAPPSPKTQAERAENLFPSEDVPVEANKASSTTNTTLTEKKPMSKLGKAAANAGVGVAAYAGGKAIYDGITSKADRGKPDEVPPSNTKVGPEVFKTNPDGTPYYLSNGKGVKDSSKSAAVTPMDATRKGAANQEDQQARMASNVFGDNTEQQRTYQAKQVEIDAATKELLEAASRQPSKFWKGVGKLLDGKGTADFFSYVSDPDGYISEERARAKHAILSGNLEDSKKINDDLDKLQTNQRLNWTATKNQINQIKDEEYKDQLLELQKKYPQGPYQAAYMLAASKEEGGVPKMDDFVYLLQLFSGFGPEAAANARMKEKQYESDLSTKKTQDMIDMMPGGKNYKKPE